MTFTRLVFLQQEGDAAYLIADGEGEVIARGILRSDSEFQQGRNILVLPGTDVLSRWIALPPCRPAQAAAAARSMLGDAFGAPPEALHIAVGAEEDGKQLVCAVDAKLMQDFLQRAAALGIVPDVVTPDYLLLPVTADETVTIAQLGALIAVRGRCFGFTAEPELASLLIGERPQQAIEASMAEYLFAKAAASPAVNLLQQEFARANGRGLIWRNFKRAAVLAAAVILSPVILWTAEIVQHERFARGLEEQSIALARTLPDAMANADPVSYVKGRVADRQASDRFLHATAALFEAVSRIEGAELDGLSYLREGIIRATVVHNKPGDVIELARTMSSSNVELDEDTSSQKDGQLSTAITLRLRR